MMVHVAVSVNIICSSAGSGQGLFSISRQFDLIVLGVVELVCGSCVNRKLGIILVSFLISNVLVCCHSP